MGIYIMFNSNAKLFMTIIVIMGLIYLLQKQEVVSNEGKVDLRAEVEDKVELETADSEIESVTESDVQEYNFDTETDSVINEVLDQRSNTNYRSREVNEPVKIMENMDNTNELKERDPIDSVFEEDITGGNETPVVRGNDLEAPSVFDKSQQVDVTRA